MQLKRLLLLLSLLSISVLHAQDVRIIKLKQKPISFSPKYFHITGVKDDRSDTTNIGFMRAGLLNKIATINLENGAAVALNNFIQTNLRQNDNTVAVELHITQLNISEKPNKLSEQADLAIAVSFYENGNKLVEYSGSSYVQTNRDASVYIESMIRQRTEELLKKFDDWKEENPTPASPPGVKVEAAITTQSDNEDMIYYDRNVPLTLGDFQGTPDDLSIGAAATASGIGMKYSHEKRGFAVTLKVSLYCYFDKSKSWCKPIGKNGKTLSHEQRHFDITAIKCYELADSIRAYQFSTDNYAKELDALLRQIDKVTGKLQQQYDQETKHGVNRDKQAQWDTDIKAKLADLKM